MSPEDEIVVRLRVVCNLPNDWKEKFNAIQVSYAEKDEDAHQV